MAPRHLSLIIQELDTDIGNHTETLIALIRRIPGLPNAEELVQAAISKGYIPGTSNLYCNKDDVYPDTTQQAAKALRELVRGLRESDKSQWPGSTGCAALETSLGAIKAFVFKRQLQIARILSNARLTTEQLPSGLRNLVRERLQWTAEIATACDGNDECSQLLTGIMDHVEELARLRGKPTARVPRRSKKQEWRPPPATKDAWETLLFNIEEVQMDDGGYEGLWAKVRWKELDSNDLPRCSQHPIEQLHLAAPQKLLNYYQKYLVISERKRR